MCGRYITKDQRALERELPFLDVTDWPQFEASYNLAPTQLAPVVISVAAAHRCRMMRFGLIPFYAQGVPGPYSTINARVESFETSPAYRGAWRRGQRCLVLAAGFYEWHQLADRRSKQPYFIHPIDQPSFAFAGLWDSSRTSSGTLIESFSIITLPASPLMAQIHNAKQREPAMLAAHECSSWLDGSPQVAHALLKAYPDERLAAWPVSTRVNSPKNNDPRLIAPLADGPPAAEPGPPSPPGSGLL